MKKAALLLIALPAIFVFSSQALFAQQKYALVIGNGNYTGISSLNNPLNDANDMETALRELGFTVDKVLNGSRVEMENAVIRFKNRLSVSKDSYMAYICLRNAMLKSCRIELYVLIHDLFITRFTGDYQAFFPAKSL